MNHHHPLRVCFRLNIGRDYLVSGTWLHGHRCTWASRKSEWSKSGPSVTCLPSSSRMEGWTLASWWHAALLPPLVCLFSICMDRSLISCKKLIQIFLSNVNVLRGVHSILLIFLLCFCAFHNFFQSFYKSEVYWLFHFKRAKLTQTHCVRYTIYLFYLF